MDTDPKLEEGEEELRKQGGALADYAAYGLSGPPEGPQVEMRLELKLTTSLRLEAVESSGGFRRRSEVSALLALADGSKVRLGIGERLDITIPWRYVKTATRQEDRHA